MTARAGVIFDLGGVLIDWDPRHLYRELIGDDVAMEGFLTEICTQAWNQEQDAGRPVAEGTDELLRRHPEHGEWIRAYYGEFDRMLKGAIEGSVDILGRVKAGGARVFALTNWARETFPIAERRFDFIGWFEAVMVSGRVGMRKPDARIFRHALDVFGLAAEDALFIDDSAANVASAESLGIRGIRFETPEALADRLTRLGLLAA